MIAKKIWPLNKSHICFIDEKYKPKSGIIKFKLIYFFLIVYCFCILKICLLIGCMKDFVNNS